MTILDNLSATTDKASTTLVDHGHHVVDLGVEQAKAKADHMLAAVTSAANTAAKQAERKTRKAAKKARRRSAAMWADFADEAAARASDALPAKLTKRNKKSKKPFVLAIIGLGAGAFVVMRLRKSEEPAAAPASYQPPTVAPDSTVNGAHVVSPEARA